MLGYLSSPATGLVESICGASTLPIVICDLVSILEDVRATISQNVQSWRYPKPCEMEEVRLLGREWKRALPAYTEGIHLLYGQDGLAAWSEPR